MKNWIIQLIISLSKKIGGSPKFAVRGQIASSGNNYSLFEKLFKNMVGYLGSM